MATRAELEAEIASKAWHVVQTGIAKSDPPKEAAGINVYEAIVMENIGAVATDRRITYFVKDEGQGSEEAVFQSKITPKSVARTAMESYLTGLVPGTYIRYRIDQIDEDNRYGFATAWKTVAGNAQEVKLIIWKNGANPIEHQEIVTV